MSDLVVLLVVLLSITFQIVSHEFGHWFVARLFGMWTPVFSVFGLGPRKYSIILGRFWNTELRISPIPIGGYVPVPEVTGHTDEDLARPVKFGNEVHQLQRFPIWKRALVALAGPAMNFIVGFLTLTVLIAVVLKMSPGAALWEGAKASVGVIWAMIVALGGMLHLVAPTPGVSGGVHTVVGISRYAAAAYQASTIKFFLVMSSISFSLGVFNLLPIPLLDGGQLLFMLIEKLRGKAMRLVTQRRIKRVFVYVLGAIFVIGLVNDFLHPLGH